MHGKEGSGFARGFLGNFAGELRLRLRRVLHRSASLRSIFASVAAIVRELPSLPLTLPAPFSPLSPQLEPPSSKSRLSESLRSQTKTQ